jgi:hypothetical protein
MELLLSISKVFRRIAMQRICYLQKTIFRYGKYILFSLHFYLLDTVNEFWWIIDDDESF